MSKGTLLILSSIIVMTANGVSADIFQGTNRAQRRPAAVADTKAAAPNARAKDREEIRTLMGSFAKAFADRDAKAMTGYWTSEGEYQNEAGVVIQGQTSLEQGFAAFFAKTPELSAGLQPESLRFLSQDSARDEGIVTIRRGPAEATTRAHYSALLVRENKAWRLASLVESSSDENNLADLSWLIGEWKSTAGSGAEIRTTYSWAPNKKFIHGAFSIKEKELSLSGTQIIGIDPATGQLHSWTFEADGGVGEADWERDGDHWVLDVAGTLADGAALMETNVLRRIDDDTFTWQSIDRLLDDEELEELPPVKVNRMKTTK